MRVDLYKSLARVVDEISRQPYIQAVGWSLLITFHQNYDKNKNKKGTETFGKLENFSLGARKVRLLESVGPLFIWKTGRLF